MHSLRLLAFLIFLFASAEICLADPAPINCASGETAQLIGGRWMCCGTFTTRGQPPLYYCTNRQQQTDYQKVCNSSTQGTYNVHVRWTGSLESCSGNTCNGPLSIGYYPDGVTELTLLRCDPKKITSSGRTYNIYEWTALCERDVVVVQECVLKPQMCGSCVGGNPTYRPAYYPEIVSSRPPIVVSDSCGGYANQQGPGTMLNDAMPKLPSTTPPPPPGGSFAGCSKSTPPKAGVPKGR